MIERHGDRALTFVWRNKGALTVTTVLETFLADPEAFLQCLLARCLPQREHDRHACARRCRRTEARNDCTVSYRQENCGGKGRVLARRNTLNSVLIGLILVRCDYSPPTLGYNGKALVSSPIRFAHSVRPVVRRIAIFRSDCAFRQRITLYGRRTPSHGRTRPIRRRHCHR